MIQAHGYYRNYTDPRQDPKFLYTTGSGTAPQATSDPDPVRAEPGDALGALPNKDASAPFQLTLTLNTLANVWGGSPTTPTFHVKVWLEA